MPQKELNFISHSPPFPPFPSPIIPTVIYDIIIYLVTQTEYVDVSQDSSLLYTANI
jgi:hypothetical protein